MEALVAMFIIVLCFPIVLGIIYLVYRFDLLDRYLDWLDRASERGHEARRRKAEKNNL